MDHDQLSQHSEEGDEVSARNTVISLFNPRIHGFNWQKSSRRFYFTYAFYTYVERYRRFSTRVLDHTEPVHLFIQLHIVFVWGNVPPDTIISHTPAVKADVCTWGTSVWSLWFFFKNLSDVFLQFFFTHEVRQPLKLTAQVQRWSSVGALLWILLALVCGLFRSWQSSICGGALRGMHADARRFSSGVDLLMGSAVGRGRCPRDRKRVSAANG